MRLEMIPSTMAENKLDDTALLNADEMWPLKICSLWTQKVKKCDKSANSSKMNRFPDDSIIVKFNNY